MDFSSLGDFGWISFHSPILLSMLPPCFQSVLKLQAEFDLAQRNMVRYPEP